MERTVKEVLPALQTNLEGVSTGSLSHIHLFGGDPLRHPILTYPLLTLASSHRLTALWIPPIQLKQILETLLKQYKQKETELQEFQREYAS